MDCFLNNREPMRVGNYHSSAAPHGCYRCKGSDEWINIAIENDEQWRNFCRVMGNPAWTKDERFANALSRWENREELDRKVEEWTQRYNHYELMRILQDASVPSGAVLSMKELHLDPHISQRGFFEVIDHGKGIGKRPIAKQIPAKFSNVEEFVPRRAPRFGQDNEEVFCNLLGISKGELEKLEEEKAIGGTFTFIRGKPTRINLVEKQGSCSVDPDYLSELSRHYGDDIGPT